MPGGGCPARCAYCGLSNKRSGKYHEKSFIRVTWTTYRLAEAIEIFGVRNAGSHFVTGMGETEKQMVEIIQNIQDMGGWTHLFSFYPEPGSQMCDHPMPAWTTTAGSSWPATLLIKI